MKRTTLRTSAIALGVAAALPATGQEWNIGWGGFIHQHVAFGSSEKKTTVGLGDLSLTVEGERGDDDDEYKATIKFVESFADSDIEAGNQLTIAGNSLSTTFANGKLTPAIITALEALQTDEDEFTAYVQVGESDDDPVLFDALHKRINAVNESIDLDGNGMHSNTEIHFTPSITLDSGLTFGATIEFEGDKEGVDQSFISISSETLGTVKIGKHGKTGLGVGAPSVGIGINSGDHHNFIAVDKGSGAMSGTNTSIIGTSDRISYTTPKNALAGFGFGISYAPGGDDGNRKSGFITSKPKADELSDNVDVSMKFEQPFGDAAFALGMRYGTAKKEGATKNPRYIGLGSSVGFGNFTFGGSYADVEGETPADSSSGWNLGASYAMDAWTFGIETYQGEADDGDEHSVSKIAASRNLGPGVAWDIYAIT
ncbi:MAG: porin, partial [Roseovarius sp.]|nr:porin [Roseovarius sp.]